MKIEDDELAIVKALCSNPLSMDEVEMIDELDVRDIMVEHGLDHLLADKVKNWAQSEYYRHRAQRQFTPSSYEEDPDDQLQEPLDRAHRPLTLASILP